MNFRKILCLVLSLAMVLSLAACGKQEEQPQQPDEPEVVRSPM